MGSCVNRRVHRTRHPALLSRLSSTRLRAIHRCLWTYTLGTLGTSCNCPRICRGYSPAKRRPNPPNSYPFPFHPHAELVGVRSRTLKGRCGVRSAPHGNNCIKVYVVPEGHAHGVIVVVCVCRCPKVIGVLTLPSVESLSLLASVLLTSFGVLPGVMFYDAACLHSYSMSLRYPSFLSLTFFVTDCFHEERRTFCPIYSARFRPRADGMRASNAESTHAAFASSCSHVRYLSEDHLICFCLPS
jgi:hypothetical protein